MALTLKDNIIDWVLIVGGAALSWPKLSDWIFRRKPKEEKRPPNPYLTPGPEERQAGEDADAAEEALYKWIEEHGGKVYRYRPKKTPNPYLTPGPEERQAGEDADAVHERVCDWIEEHGGTPYRIRPKADRPDPPKARITGPDSSP